MCGIAGIFERRGGAPDLRVLDSMTDRLAHRGPDGRGTYAHGGVGFGHRRLAIIGLRDGAQPMSNEDGRVWVTFNGEIYNHLALRGELEALGHRFASRADTEVLVHGWEAWGPGLVARLRGIFAFAVHDQRAGAVFLARDRLGVKPLYYALAPERLLFASEPKAILVHPDVPRRPDLDAVLLYLRYGYVPPERSAFEGLAQLGPGARLLVTEAAAQGAQYWRPPPLGGAALRSDEVAATLDRLVDDAVESELMSEVPLGAFLSGGVDSSTVAASMARSRRLAARPKTYCIGFAAASHDESAHAARVAAHLGLDHHAERVADKDLALLERLVEVYDEPFADASAIPTYALCSMARRHVTVALSGDGGDEVFAGYRRYARLAGAPRVPAPVRRAVGVAARLYPSSLRGAGTLRGLALSSAARYEQALAVPAPLLRATVGPELTRRRPEWSIAALFEAAPGEELVQKAQWCDLVSYLPGDILTKVDRASMAHALEVRVPLLDHLLVEWALRLPQAHTFGGGEGKVALKAHLARRLPRALFARPKMGFGVPLEAWSGGPTGLLALVERLRARHPGRSFRAPIVAEAVTRLARDTRRREHGALVWSLLFLEAWWQKNF